MAAFTSKADGNWSASGQTTWTQVGVPANGDTVTLSHNITVDVNTTIGASGATGTTAITFSGTSFPAKILTINTGVTLTCRGNITTTSTNKGSLILNAGSTFTMDPASGARYDINVTDSFNIECNGSVGSRCTFQTSLARGGTAGLCAGTGDRYLRVATYTDFTNWGTTAVFGLWSIPFSDAANYGLDYTITDCTFTACSYDFNSQSAWAHALTFARNIFSSSPSTNDGFGNSSARFQSTSSEAGTKAITFCYFDQALEFYDQQNFTFTDNVLAGGLLTPQANNWPAAANTARNFIYLPSQVNLLGNSAKDWFVFHSGVSNPHYIQTANNSWSFDGCLFQAESTNDGSGDVIFAQDGVGSSWTLSVKNCIGLPSANGNSCGNLVSGLGNISGTAITVEHCTFCATNADGGIVGFAETIASYAGEFASVRGNVVWGTAGTHITVASKKGVQTQPSNTITVAGYNGLYNPTSGTVTANSVGYTVPGYKTVIVSTAGDPNSNGNTQIAFHDVIANPGFIDSTRNLETWSVSQGGAATSTAAIALLKANPALVGQAVTGLLAWVRAGYVPTSVAFQAASYPGDTSLTDAAGTSWPGGSPGLGAMAVYNVPATAGPIFPQRYSSPAKPVAAGWV